MKLNILDYLSRPDKWFLGGGDAVAWCPPFPVWLDYPGFWDRADLFQYAIEPMFTVTLLDDEGREINLHSAQRRWNPAFLEQVYTTERHLDVIERKAVVRGDAAVAEFQITNRSKKSCTLHVIAWTIQSSFPSLGQNFITGLSSQENGITFVKNQKLDGRPPFRVSCVLKLHAPVISCAVQLSEGSAVQPQWRLSPFFEQFRSGRLSNEIDSESEDRDGLLFMGLHSVVRLAAHATKKVTVSFGILPEARRTKFLSASASVQSWRRYFSKLPYFECSDEWLTRYYWYRWYGLNLFTVRKPHGMYKYSFVCEGLGYFRGHISYSAQCHMLETRWMRNPDLARGSLLNFIEHQRRDGSFLGYIQVDSFYSKSFYHANWGNSVLEVDRLHPDKKFLARVYRSLTKYVEYFDRVRDREGSSLYDVVNHYETGQEYMSRYLAVDPKADSEHWGNVFRLKGVDATVYVYELKKALAKLAERLGLDRDQNRWSAESRAIKEAILHFLWDPDQRMFFDLNPRTWKRTGVKTATCFYPYMTDIVDESHLGGFKQHLFNPREFWTPYPVASTSADDPMFCAEPRWKGKRMSCPWNGRVWPMTNSHIAEAIAQSAIRFGDGELRLRFVEFLNKYIRMMFYDGDPRRPNCFEHYNPYTGQPSLYRGVDDYQHSWVVDLIIKYVVGLRPTDAGVVVDPFPFELSKVLLDNVHIRGYNLKVERKRERVRVWMNGRFAAQSNFGMPMFIEFK